MEDSQLNSVLVNSLSICISLLDPKRHTLGTYHLYNRQLTPVTTITTKLETVEGMLECLGEVIYISYKIWKYFFATKALLIIAGGVCSYKLEMNFNFRIGCMRQFDSKMVWG